MDALDGLRTIAVFLVVLFHVATPGLGAGFIGVDVFFVLSGYLITSGMVREVQRNGHIALATFWQRRLKRLMPAAMLVLLVVLAWTWWFAPVYRRFNLGGDIFWTVIYLGNWHFMQAGSYFTADGTESPLLHMWSLAVEEQFYLAWPLLLTVVPLLASLVLRRRRAASHETSRTGRPDADTSATSAARTDRFMASGIVVGALILLISVVLLAALYQPTSPDRAYQGTDSKAFEPMLGALVALLLTRPGVTDWVQRQARTLGWVGALTMVGLFPFMGGPSAFYFRGGALLFSVGTAAVLLACVHAPRWPIARALAWGPMAYLGRISYGIYLWHWPLAVWFNAHAAWRPWRALAVVLLTVALAAVSYRWLETPIRSGRLSGWLTRRRTFTCAAAMMALVLVLDAPLGGSPLSPVADAVLPKPPLNAHNILMVGDSVPQRLMPALAPAGSAQGLLIGATTAGGCSPLGVHQLISPDDTAGIKCPSIRDKQVQGLHNMNPATVVWWSRYEIADRYQGDKLLTAGTPEFWAAEMADFKDAVNRLTANGAILVVVLTESPGVGMRSRCSPSKCHPFLQRMVTQDDLRQHWNALVSELAAHDKRLRVITMNDVLCNKPATFTRGVWGSSLCDDHLDATHLRRPDGSHVDVDRDGAAVANALIARVRKATGH